MTIDIKQLTAWRREFHTFPEIGWSEFWTTAKLVEKLEAMGYQALTGKQVINPEFVRGRNQTIVDKGIEAAKARGVSDAMLQRMDGLTGCVVELDTGVPGPTIALRFDIDCVNVEETDAADHQPNVAGFRSQNPGYMHACGHDGHITVGLAVAAWLQEHKAELKGKIKLLFQPAEEGVRGARPMAESGVLDGVDYFASSHIGFIAPSGTVIVAPTGFLSTLKIDVRYKGKASHAGGQPQEGRNALAAACHATTQMLGISRHSEGMTRINVGVLRAGEGRNVIPAHAEMQVEVRGENQKLNNYMADQVMRIAHGVAQSFDVEVSTEIMGEACDLQADQEMIDHVTAVAQSLPAVKELLPTQVFGGSEDATILGKKVQENGGKAIYFVVGTDLKAYHHQDKFDFVEEDLATAVAMFTGLVQRLAAR